MFDYREELGNLAIFLALGATILTSAKIDWNSFVLIFEELPNVFSFFFYDQ